MRVSRLITVFVICAVFPLVVCLTASHCSEIVSVDIDGKK